MKNILLGLFFLLIASNGICELSIVNLAHEVRGIRLVDLEPSDLPKGKEEAVLAILRENKNWATLLRLDDQETVNLVASRYSNTRGKNEKLKYALWNSYSPYVLDELAPYLYSDNEYKFEPWGERYNPYYGFSHSVAELFKQIVSNAPEFSEEVRKAAIDLRPDNEMIGVFRNWWEINRGALEQLRYDDVSLPIIAKNDALLKGEKLASVSSNQEEKTNRVRTFDHEKSAESVKESMGISSPNEKMNYGLIAIFSIGVLAIVYLVLRRSG